MDSISLKIFFIPRVCRAKPEFEESTKNENRTLTTISGSNEVDERVKVIKPKDGLIVQNPSSQLGLISIVPIRIYRNAEEEGSGMVLHYPSKNPEVLTGNIQPTRKTLRQIKKNLELERSRLRSFPTKNYIPKKYTVFQERSKVHDAANPEAFNCNDASEEFHVN